MQESLNSEGFELEIQLHLHNSSWTEQEVWCRAALYFKKGEQNLFQSFVCGSCVKGEFKYQFGDINTSYWFDYLIVFEVGSIIHYYIPVHYKCGCLFYSWGCMCSIFQGKTFRCDAIYKKKHNSVDISQTTKRPGPNASFLIRVKLKTASLV